MFFKQFYLGCLAHASYLIGSGGEAAVIDPQRDVDQYLDEAVAQNLRVKYIIETHLHADFISGHHELAARTGAEIVFGEKAGAAISHRAVKDGDELSVGQVRLRILETPGHTPESICILVNSTEDADGDDRAAARLLTGDTLFIGDVGRPDLLASIGFTREELADKLYDSLHDKLMTLPDATRVYPAHGAGSACGKNLSTDLWSTIGEQKATNYALRAPDKATFMELVTEGQPPAPSYFIYDAILNRKAHGLLDESKRPTPMTYEQVLKAIDGGAVLVDGRSPEEFAQGHLRHAINIGLEGRYAEFAGSVLPPDVDIVLFTEPGQELEGKNRLARIGFDRVIGYLGSPFKTMFEHQDDVVVASRLTAKAFDERAAQIAGLQVVDVRNPGETAAGTIPGAITIPVGQLPARLGELDASVPTVVYCAGGYRSSVAASLLRHNGFADVSDILGGYRAWTETTQNV
jgi:glyoxylase-like metal-dependent hydrolase (beta-lactamase superfamily II)/rhodanese-related sulfurtransferase